MMGVKSLTESIRHVQSNTPIRDRSEANLHIICILSNRCIQTFRSLSPLQKHIHMGSHGQMSLGYSKSMRMGYSIMTIPARTILCYLESLPFNQFPKLEIEESKIRTPSYCQGISHQVTPPKNISTRLAHLRRGPAAHVIASVQPSLCQGQRCLEALDLLLLLGSQEQDLRVLGLLMRLCK